MRISIRTYLLYLFSFALTIVVGISLCLNNMFLEEYYLYRNEKIFQNVANEIMEILEKDLTKDEIEDSLFEIDRLNQVSIEVLDRSLARLFISHSPNTNNLDKSVDHRIHMLISANKDSLRETHIYKIIDDNKDSTNILIYIERIPNSINDNIDIDDLSGGKYIAITRLLQPIDENIDIMNNFYMISGIIALIVSWIFTIKFSKKFTEPIIEISEIAKNMADLKFDETINYNQNNELGDLSNSINFLSTQLEKNIIDLKDEIEFQKLLSRNTSHELKTPIAIIKGYAEGLYYGIVDTEEERIKYMEVIIQECDRMDNLVKEMLTLSKITYNKLNSYSMENFNSLNLKNQIESVFINLMQQKNIDFNINIEETNIFGNEELIIQSVYNFISNAMKYGDGNKISMTLEKVENKIIIQVFNTGEKISEDEIKKIFNIFHIVDESRTRDKNGHGLGLAIVKSIAEVHNGIAYGMNQEDGVCFVIEIPIEPK